MNKQITEERKKKLDSLFEALSIVGEGVYVYLCDMEYDYSRWSKLAVDTFGLEDEYIYAAGEVWEQHVHPEDRDAYRRSINSIFSGENAGHDMQYRARKSNGEYEVCTCKGLVIRDSDGNPQYFGGAIRNHGIYTNVDSLTGLRNQYGFFEDLRNHIHKNMIVNICMLGINHFTEVNEMYGYIFGNRILQKFGRYLQDSIGSLGNVYRMDGTKFIVTSTSQSVREMIAKYNDLRKHLRQGMQVEDKFLILDINGGLLHLDNFDVSDQTAYACLNFAYGESKVRRQGELVEFYNDLTAENKNRLERIQVIRNSIARDFCGFYLLYQPVVDARSERVIGAEALLRWRDQKYGIVPPDHFIPILERDPVFISLGRWILRTAMLDAKEILEICPHFVINVNLSYAQLEKPDFIDMIIELLDETGYPPQNLCLEITERCRLLDLSLLKNILVNLRAKGIKFALDDFGTGFSSVGIVKDLHFDTIKIDRSFVQNIEVDSKERELIANFTAIATIFDAGICVEGIETSGMRDVLKEYGVTSFQGYYYSRPVPMEEFPSMDKKLQFA